VVEQAAALRGDGHVDVVQEVGALLGGGAGESDAVLVEFGGGEQAVKDLLDTRASQGIGHDT